MNDNIPCNDDLYHSLFRDSVQFPCLLTMPVTVLEENERNHDSDIAHTGDGSDNTSSATPSTGTNVGHAFHTLGP